MTEADLPDADCDGIADEDECLLYTNVSNGLIDIVEAIIQCPYEEIIVTVPSCNDNNDCTFNDHLDADCNCIGTPMSVDIPDPNNGSCINNAGQCRILNQVYGGEDQSRGGLSQYPVRWQGGGGITTPDIIDGHVRVRGISYNTTQDHEGIVLPLCCPLKNDGGGYQLQLDAAFLPIYNGLEATLLVQASMDAPSIDNPLNRDCTASGDYICLGEIELTDNMISAHPTRIQNCRDEDGNIIGTQIIPDEFWYNSNQTVDYTMESIVFNLDFGQAGNVSCGSDVNQYNFIYLSILIEGDNSDHTNDNNILQNCGGLQFRGGGSLLMNNINIFKLEPPINLERHSMVFDACTGEEEEEIEPVTNFDIGPTNCGFEICEGDDFMLCVTDIIAAPFCIPVQNIVWQRVDENGEIICPEDRQFGECFEIEKFGADDQGFVRLTVTDNSCNCTNEFTFRMELREDCAIYCTYQLRYSACLVDQHVTGNPFPFSPFFNSPGQDVQDCEPNPDQRCHLLMCSNDYESIHFNFGEDKTVTFFPFSSNTTIDAGDLARDCNTSKLEQDRNFCEEGNFVLRPALDPFGIYVITDNICPSNTSCFVIEEDTPPQADDVIVDLNCDSKNSEICLTYAGVFNENHELVQFSIDGGSSWSDNLSANNEFCFDGLLNDNYMIMVRWGDNPSCCIKVDDLDLTGTEFNTTAVVKEAFCNQDNGSILMSPSDLTYSWSNGMTGHYIQCLGAGTYEVTVSDGVSCEFSAHTFSISSVNVDVIDQEFQGNTDIAGPDPQHSGIKLAAGTELTWCFTTYWISDRLIIETSVDPDFSNGNEVIILDTGPVSSYTEICCDDVEMTGIPGTNDESYCNCSDQGVYLGEYSSGSMIPLDVGSGTALIVGSGCSFSNKIHGSLILQSDAWVRVLVDNQLCNEEGDFTLWNLVVTCGEANDPCVAGDSKRLATGLREAIEYNSIEASTGILDDEIKPFKLVPNPANQKVTIVFPSDNKNAVYNTSIINLKGEFISSQVIDKRAEIDLSDLSEGVYYVRITDGNNTWIEKLVVVKSER